MSKSLEARVSVLEDAVGSALGIALSEFDPEARAAKQKAEAEAAEERAKAEQAERDEADARRTAQAEAEAAAKEEEDARVQAILEAKNKKKK